MLKVFFCLAVTAVRLISANFQKINGLALVIKAGFRAVWAGRVMEMLVLPPLPPPNPNPHSPLRRLSHHSPLQPACPVMTCITCSVVGLSCVTRLYSIFVH